MLCAFVFLESLASISSLPAQTETTASLGGTVTDAGARAALAGVRVMLRHDATGDIAIARTNASGHFLFTGLRVGDGYSLRATAPGYDAADIPNLALSLGEQRQLDLALADAASRVHHLERFTVTARRERPPPGVNTTLSERDIEHLPAIDQTINYHATADPRITMIDEENSVISALGQNVLFNSLQIDGIRLDDAFGVTSANQPSNGLPALGNPFSMETIEAIAVDLTPYDAARGGFTGASINAVTKSGRNTFAGTAYHTYRNEKFRAADPRTGKRTPFTDRTFGFTLGGPLVPDRLFFFASWERSRHTDPSRETGFTPAAGSVARITAIAREKYGIDPGLIIDPGERSRQSDRYMAKLDWRIHARHRLTARHTASRGDQPVYADYAGTSYTSFNSHWYANSRNLDAWSAQLFSQWHDTFHTEIAVAHQRYNSDRIPNARLPQIRVGKIDGDENYILFGADATSMVNRLATEKRQAKINATWLRGAHRIQFGAEHSRDDFDDRFLEYAWGYYSYASIDDFDAGKMSGYTLAYTPDGSIPGKRWRCAINAAHLQDTWRPIPSLSLTAGLRVECPDMPQKPAANPLVEHTFGMRNDATLDGRCTFSPRFSFAWTPAAARAVQVRGGAGVFQGRTPGVWMQNTFVNDGLSAVETNETPGTLIADVDNQPKGKPNVTSTRMRVDMLDPRLRLPSVARGNIAIDVDLPWQNMRATVEWLRSRTRQSLAYRNLNLRQRAESGPDGRPLFGTWRNKDNGDIEHITRSQLAHDEFSDVYLLTNAAASQDKSNASYLTFQLRRPVRNHWGASLSYTRGRATEVTPLTSSSASANFGNRICFDANSYEAGTSNTEVRDRLLATLTANIALIRKFQTVVHLVYDGHSGRPCSFTFRNDANGDGVAANDLFYVPAHRNDPKIYWRDPAEAEAFFAYLATNPALRRYAGRVVPRNSERGKFQHRVSLQVTQQIPFWRTLRAEVVCSIMNLANLLNPKWGLVYQYSAPYNIKIASGYYDENTGQYRYEYPSAPAQPTLQSYASRWQIQAALKVKF